MDPVKHATEVFGMVTAEVTSLKAQPDLDPLQKARVVAQLCAVAMQALALCHADYKHANEMHGGARIHGPTSTLGESEGERRLFGLAISGMFKLQGGGKLAEGVGKHILKATALRQTCNQRRRRSFVAGSGSAWRRHRR